LRCFANKQAWLDFGDLYTEDSAPVVLNCRTDAVRDQLHKTLRQLIDSDVELGRNLFLALFDRSVVRSQINGLSLGRPQLNWIEHLTTERRRYDGEITGATPFATETCDRR
jgi:hypothetical protein